MATLFEEIARKERPAHILYEDDLVMAILDIFPTNAGHTLFIPKAFSETMLSTPDETLAHLLVVIKKIAPAILASVHATDFNLLTNVGPVAGQVIMHTHFHLIPRFADDGLKHWQSRSVTQESLGELAAQIRSQLDS